MITLYQQRLQNLTNILQQLHKIIKNDEVLNHLSDPTLQKYRIDRINQIVIEVLNSQKQRMLIRVLQKYQQVSLQLKLLKEKQEQSQLINARKSKQVSYYDNFTSLKQKSQTQIIKLTNLIDQKNQIIERATKQINILKQKLNNQQNYQKITKQPCRNCERLIQKSNQYQTQISKQSQFIQKLKKDGEDAVKILNNKITNLNQKNNQLEIELSKKPSVIHRQSSEDFGYKNESVRRTQKVQIMRRQIAFLQEQLIQVQKQFNMVKDLSLGSITMQVKKLKNLHKKLQQYIKQVITKFSHQLSQNQQKIIQKITKTVKKSPQSLKPEKLMSKLNQLQNQLDYFIENQISVE